MAEKIKVTKDMFVGDEDIQKNIEDLAGSVESLPSNDDLIKKIKDIGVSREETRILVDSYYQIQNKRIACQSQIRSIIQESDNSIDHQLLSWSFNQMMNMEKGYLSILDSISCSSRVGRWLREIKGIGPVLAAALQAYFDIDRAKSAGAFWSYAGLNDNLAPKIGKDRAKKIVETCIAARDGKLDDVTVARVAEATGRKLSVLLEKSSDKKGKIKKDDLIKAVSFMPYNKDLKVICWKVGHQFTLLQNKESSLYGRIMRERKAYETMKNEHGDYADQAARILGTGNWEDMYEEEDFQKCADILTHKDYGKTTDAYKALSKGMLPAAQIQSRAARYATKLFISHLFEMMYEDKYGKPAPDPYVIAHQGHKDYIGPEVPYDWDRI